MFKPFDPFNPFDIQAAKEYEAKLSADAKANPKIGKGMSVEIVSLPGEVIAEGLIIDLRWNNGWDMHEALVLHDGIEYWILEQFLRKSRGPIRDVFVNNLMECR